MSSKEGALPIEDRSSFLARLDISTPEDKEFIMYAYDVAKVAHRGTLRQGGDRYFEHPRTVGLILIDECKITDPNIIAASLLHDVAEDTPTFGSVVNKSYEEWISRVSARIGSLFNPQVADMVACVTKPPQELEDIGSGENSLVIYYRNLEQATPEALLVKMADRLHNLRTLMDTPLEKQKRKVEETKNHYFPLFEKVRDYYPNEYQYLIDQMGKAIKELNLA